MVVSWNKEKLENQEGMLSDFWGYFSAKFWAKLVPFLIIIRLRKVNTSLGSKMGSLGGDLDVLKVMERKEEKSAGMNQGC